jgi:hypothetical protein
MLELNRYSGLRCFDDGSLEVRFLCEVAVKVIRKLIVLLLKNVDHFVLVKKLMQAKRCRSLEFGYANTEDVRSRVSRVRAKHRRGFVPSIRTASKQEIVRPKTGR